MDMIGREYWCLEECGDYWNNVERVTRILRCLEACDDVEKWGEWF